jgi:hypothetical protein
MIFFQHGIFTENVADSLRFGTGLSLFSTWREQRRK